MSTKRFDLERLTDLSYKLEQRFSYTGKIRGADVLRQLVETCGYEVIREALEKLKPQPVAPPAPKRRKAKSTDPSK